MPKVSIGIPVYNGERFLPEALDSMLNQEVEDFELIVSDNASEDRTEEVARSYCERDPRVRYHRNEVNVGLVANFNRVFELSTGAYFRWAASDDVLEPQYLTRCIEVLDSDPGVVLAASEVRLIEADGSPVRFDAGAGHHVTRYGEELQSAVFPSSLGSHRVTERFRDVVMSLTSNPLASCIYGLGRRDAIARALPMQPYLGSEKVLLARLALEGRFYIVPEKLFVRRFHPEHFGMHTPKEATKLINPAVSKVHFTSGKQLYGYLRAIKASSLGPSQRLRLTGLLLTKVTRVIIERITRVFRR